MSKVEEIFNEIISNESEVKEFLSKDTMEEMYKFFLTKDNSITVEEFDEYVAKMLEEYFHMSENKSIEHLSEENIEIAGGLSFNDIKGKIAPIALSALTLLPGMHTMVSAAGVNTGSNSTVIHKVNKSEDVEQGAFNTRFSKVRELLKKHSKKITVGIGAAMLAVGAGIAVKKYNNHKDKNQISGENSIPTPPPLPNLGNNTPAPPPPPPP